MARLVYFNKISITQKTKFAIRLPCPIRNWCTRLVYSRIIYSYSPNWGELGRRFTLLRRHSLLPWHLVWPRLWIDRLLFVINKSPWCFFHLFRVFHGSRGEVLPEKLGGVVRPTSHNPYPIFDQNLRFFLPYLWPGQKFDTLFMTVAAGVVALKLKLWRTFLDVLIG